jgi:GH25 family lysozyme M1 (1,4-beta-N-acetylmuramidase)
VSQCLIAGGLDLNVHPGADYWGCIPSCTNLHDYLVNYLGATYETRPKSQAEPIWFVPGDPAIFPTPKHAVFAVTGDATHYATCNAHSTDRYHKTIQWFFDNSNWNSCTYYHIPTNPADVTLTLYVHEGSASGPVLSGVRVTGQDGAGTSFDKTTGTSGYVTITGAPGSWQFSASKSGYQTNSWSQSTTETCTRHAFLIRDDRVNGIDVSHWQGTIDWSQVYNSGYRFAFAKASEGDGLEDTYFTANMNNGYNAGMLMGAYHFARPDLENDAADEARYFVSVAGTYLKVGYLRPALDLEKGASLGKEALSNWVHEWMNTVKSETGIEPIIYVNSNYANNYLDSSVTQYDLWIAHWRCDTGTPPNTGMWNDWDFWQYYSPDYCGVNSVPGISGGVDLDIFNGDMDRLYTFVIESEEPALSLSSTSHDFGDKCEGETDSITFEIWNSGTGTLTYTLSESCGWVDVNPTSGSSTGEHDTITVDIDTTGLAEGSHTCDISIGSNDGSGTFTVTVNIVAQTGSISVSSSPSGANIYLDGSFRGLTPYTITNVPVGVHTIRLSLAGYQDWSTNVQVTAGETSYVYASLIPITSTAPTAIFRNGLWCVDTTGNHIADLVFGYGILGDVPIVGDINKDGPDDIAIFRNGLWCVDTTGNHIADLVFGYGIPGDVPLVGDFNKDGSDDIAIFRNGLWCVDTTGNHIADLVFGYGIPGDVPIVGDINKDGSDDIAIFRNGLWCVDSTGNHIADLVFGYGIAGDVPLVGDFNKDGSDDIAIFRNGLWCVDTTGNHIADLVFGYGIAGDIPVVGDIG